jgi:hypothetical protein
MGLECTAGRAQLEAAEIAHVDVIVELWESAECALESVLVVVLSWRAYPRNHP